MTELRTREGYDQTKVKLADLEKRLGEIERDARTSIHST